MTVVTAGVPTTPSRNGLRLVLMRTLCLVVAVLALGVFIIALPARLDQLQHLSPVMQEEGRVAQLVSMQLSPDDARALLQLGLSVQIYALYHLAIEVAFTLTCAGVGVLLLWRRWDEWIALLVALSLIAAAAAIPPTINAFVVAHPEWQVLGDIVVAAYVGTNVVIYLFPDGRFVPRWTRWATAILLVWTFAWVVFPSTQLSAWPLVPSLIATLIIIGTFAFSQVYRFVRVSGPVQRQQTKWFVLGLSLGMVAVIIYDFNLPGLFFPSLAQPGPNRLIFNFVSRPVYYAFRMLPPVAITVAILRYRLWDIDRLINRTLVYGTLTVVVALVYAGSVVLLQQLFRPLFGGGHVLSVVMSTLTIATLFRPLRHRIQATIDRRFYHRKYDAAQTLQAFSANLRNEVDVNRLSQAMLDVVQETLQPAHVSLWLRRPKAQADAHPPPAAPGPFR